MKFLSYQQSHGRWLSSWLKKKAGFLVVQAMKVTVAVVVHWMLIETNGFLDRSGCRDNRMGSLLRFRAFWCAIGDIKNVVFAKNED